MSFTWGAPAVAEIDPAVDPPLAPAAGDPSRVLGVDGDLVLATLCGDAEGTPHENAEPPAG